MTPFLYGLIAGLMIGVVAGFVLAGLMVAAREDRFWRNEIKRGR